MDLNETLPCGLSGAVSPAVSYFSSTR